MKWAFLASFFTVIYEPDFLSPLPDPEPMLSYCASLFFSPDLFIYYLCGSAPSWYQHVGSLSCGIQDLVPWPGIEPRSHALGAQSLRHWTTIYDAF